jgi:hypothetical protein
MLEVRVRTLLAPDSQNAVSFAHRLGQFFAFLDGKGQWFFQIDIFPGFTSVYGNQCMPMIGVAITTASISGRANNPDIFRRCQLLDPALLFYSNCRSLVRNVGV